MGSIRLQQYNCETFMNKRNLQMTNALNIVLILLIFTNQLVIFGYVHHPEGIIFLLSAGLWSICVFVWICLLAIRNWLIFYRYKWTYYVSTSKWQQIINPNVLNDDVF